jgi:hypothetical protein
MKNPDKINITNPSTLYAIWVFPLHHTNTATPSLHATPSGGELIQIFTPLLGWILLTLLGHIGFFALFGVLLVCAFILTIKWRKLLLFE